MHVGNMKKGMVPGIAIVGGGVPLAAGMALALKMQKSSAVVACFFGDGAIAEGAFHEGVNLAAIWDLPVIFVCENNLYGASTRVDRVMRNERIADRAAAYGIRGERVDGNDVLAVYEATRSAAADCRAGAGPSCSSCSRIAEPATRAATAATISPKKRRKAGSRAIRSNAWANCLRIVGLPIRLPSKRCRRAPRSASEPLWTKPASNRCRNWTT